MLCQVNTGSRLPIYLELIVVTQYSVLIPENPLGVISFCAVIRTEKRLSRLWSPEKQSIVTDL